MQEVKALEEKESTNILFQKYLQAVFMMMLLPILVVSFYNALMVSKWRFSYIESSSESRLNFVALLKTVKLDIHQSANNVNTELYNNFKNLSSQKWKPEFVSHTPLKGSSEIGSKLPMLMEGGKIDSRTKKPYITKPTGDLPACKGEEIEQGRWVHDPSNPRAEVRYEIMGSCIDPYVYSCNRIKSNITVPRMKAAMEWVWTPKNCKILKFEPLAFLKKFSGRHFLSIGDSMATEWFLSMKCQLRGRIPQHRTYMIRADRDCLALDEQLRQEYEMYANMTNSTMDSRLFHYNPYRRRAEPLGELGCRTNDYWESPAWEEHPQTKHPYFRFSHRNSRFLGAHAAYNDRVLQDGKNRLERWWRALLKVDDYDAIIINTGLHWVDVPNPLTEMQFLANRTAHVLKKLYNGKIVLRNTRGNINKCSEFDKPFKIYEEVTENPDNWLYNWKEIPAYNKMWINAFRENNLEFFFFDTWPGTLNPLGKIGYTIFQKTLDCVHSCLPGLLDRWSDWFWTFAKEWD